MSNTLDVISIAHLEHVVGGAAVTAKTAADVKRAAAFGSCMTGKVAQDNVAEEVRLVRSSPAGANAKNNEHYAQGYVKLYADALHGVVGCAKKAGIK